MMSILGEYYKHAVTAPGYIFDPSEIFTQLDPTESEFGDYMNYFRKLPINDKPDAFGLHDNADIAYANNQTMFLLNTLLALQPRSAGGGISREDVVSKIASEIEAQLPPVFDLEGILKKYPVMYEESMNTVLQQEAQRFNKLLKEMKGSLGQMQKAIKGII